MPQTPQLLNIHVHKVTPASGADLGPVGQCDLTFRLGNEQFTNRFIVLWDLHRNIILGLNWQCNYRIGCNWNIKGQQYITHNNKFLCTSIPSSNTKVIIYNSGSAILPPRSVSVISEKVKTKLNTRYLYQLNATDNLPCGILPLVVDHKIDHKYPNLIRIPLLNTEHNTIQIPRKTVIGQLQPIDVTDSEVNNMSWTTDHTTPTNKPAELPCTLTKLEHNINKHSVVLEDAHMLQEAKDGLSSLPEGEYNKIISKLHTDVVGTNLFKMDIPSMGLPVAHKPCPILLKYQKFVSEEIKLLENTGCISKCLSLWATPVITVPKKPDPTNPCKQQFCLVFDFRSLNKSINATQW